MDSRFHRKFTAGGRRFYRCSWQIVLPLVGSLSFLWMVPVAKSEEPAAAFLEALRREGLLDLANHYLEQCEKSSITPTDFRLMIPFERAKTLYAGVRTRLEIRKRIEDLTAIDSLLANYSGPVKPDELATAPLQLRGDCNLLRARLLVLRSRQESNEVERRKFEKEADTVFAMSATLSQQVVDSLKTYLESQRKLPPESQNIQLREIAQKNYLESQANLPQVAFERAQLFPDGSAERKQFLSSAAQGFSDLLKKYSSQAQYYLQFLIQSGRCYAQLGDSKEAASRFGEVLEAKGVQPAATGLATAGLMEIWRKDPKLADKSLPAGEAWIAAHDKEPAEILAPVQVALAQSLLQRTEDEAPPVAAKTRKKIRALLRDATRIHGESADEARTLLANLPGSGEGTAGAVDLDALANFKEARAEAENAIGRMQSAEQGKGILNDQLAHSEMASPRAELEQGIADAEREITTNRRDAVLCLKHALALATPEQSAEELNQVRFTLGYLFFLEGRYYESAVLCEFVARQDSEAPQARPAARTALACFARLLEAKPDSSFAKRRVLEMSQFAAARWPKEEEGKKAMLTSLQMLVGMGELREAKKYLAQLPEGSEIRPDGELAMGSALYREYQLQKANLANSGQPLDPLPDEIRALLTEARGYLESGLKLRSGMAVTAASALAMISLAGVYYDQGELNDSSQLLHDKDRGLLLLVSRNDPAVSGVGFREDIYRLALKTHLAAMSKAGVSADSGNLDAFKKLMDGLKGAVGDSPEGKQRLLGNYMALARDLQERVESAPAAARPAIADSFEVILSQIGSQSEDVQTVHWVVQTLVGLADAFPTKAGNPDLRAKRFLEAAEKELRRIADSPAVREDAALNLQTKLKLASIKRRQQDFRGAIELFAEVLRNRNQLLNVQIEAAQTYQEGKAYDFAVKGGRPETATGKNLIWGWERINHILTRELRGNAQNSEYTRLLHESRLQIATCRFEQAKVATAERRTELLQRAERAILSLRGFDPTYGGSLWFPKYDRLLREIQAALGKNASGLQGVSNAATAKQG